LPKEVIPVGNATGEETDMDIVEGVLFKSPLQRTIVDLELHIRRDPAGLDGRDVDSNDLCVRKLFGEITERLVVSIL